MIDQEKGWLKDLPVTAHVESMSVMVLYVEERGNVKSVEDLKAFFERWDAVWDWDNDESVNASEGVLAEMNRLQQNGEEPAYSLDSIAAINILVPRRLLQATRIALRCDVPYNVALVQRYATEEEMELFF